MIAIEVAAGVLIAFAVRGVFLWWMENTDRLFGASSRRRVSLEMTPRARFWSWRYWRVTVIGYAIILLLGLLVVVFSGGK